MLPLDLILWVWLIEHSTKLKTRPYPFLFVTSNGREQNTMRWVLLWLRSAETLTNFCPTIQPTPFGLLLLTQFRNLLVKQFNVQL